MNLAPLSLFWLQMIGLLAVELCLVAAILSLVLRHNPSARWRRTCCQAALLAALVIGLGELSGTNRSLASWMAVSGSPTPVPATTAKIQTPAPAPVLAPAFAARVNARLATLPPIDPQSVSSQKVARPADAPPAAVASRLANAEVARPPLGLWILALWVSGITIVGGRVCLARCVFVLFQSRRRAVTDVSLLSQIKALSHSLAVSRPIRVIESSRLKSPIAFGVFRPAIGLPLRFRTTFDWRKQQVMLAHELAHLAARDPVWYWLADLVTALFWWHPAAWWLRRQLQLASEWAADEASLLVDDGPRALAECLVELGARLAGPPVPGQLRIEGFRSNLGWRVQRLLNLEHRTWSPPRRYPTALIQAAGPIALTLTLITCTAWTLPRAITEGETMKNVPLTWKRSLAALGVIMGLAAEASPAGAEPPASAGGVITSPAVQPSARAESDLFQQRNGLSRRAAEVAQAIPAPTTAAPAAADPLRQRYGLPPAAQAGTVPGAELPRPGVQLEAKLKQIVLEEVQLDGLPMSEVLVMLSSEARKRDATKKGINFLINPNLPAGPAVPSIDPTTGLAMAAAPMETFDLASVSVRFSLPLRNVTMKDVLDAIVKVADKPIEYALEDYAVVFSPRPEAAAGMPVRTPQPMAEMLAVRTFKVDTNTFVAGLENAFGITIDKSTGAKASGARRALNELLSQLGITLGGNKSVFYNELTGVVMVRATEEDLQVVRAAMETLGGALYEQTLSRTP